MTNVPATLVSGQWTIQDITWRGGIRMCFKVALFLLFVLHGTAGDFVHNFPAGFSFIFHHGHDLLLILHNDSCYFVKSSYPLDDILKKDVNRTQELHSNLISFLNDPTLVRNSTMDAERDQYMDLLADFRCEGKNIFDLDIPDPALFFLNHSNETTKSTNPPAVTYCPPQTVPDHGFVTPTSCASSNATAGTRCTFQCDDSFFQTSGPTFVTCTTGGQWSSTDSVVCTDTQPPTVSCPNDVVLTAPEGLTSVNGTWPPPNATDNAGNDQVTLTTGVAPGTILQEGRYDIVVTATDQEGLESTCTFSVTVTVKRCRSPSAPTHGTLLNSTCSTLMGSTCPVGCDVGYALDGPNEITCFLHGHDAEWSSLPKCKQTTCSELVAPAHGSITPTSCLNPGSQIGSTCRVSCDAGYDLTSGPETVNCTASGQWDDNGNHFQCTEMRCPALHAPAHGRIQPADCHTTQGAVCHVVCDSGYTLSGSGEVTCSLSGGQATWSSIPSCDRVTCPQLSAPDHASVTPSSCVQAESNAGTTCSVACDSGFFLTSGSPSVRCTDPGKWSNTQPIICTDIVSPTVTCPSDVTVIVPDGQTSAQVNWPQPNVTDNAGAGQVSVTYDVQPGTTLQEGRHTVVLMATDSSGQSATCNFAVTVLILRCPSLSAPAFGSVVTPNCPTLTGSTCNVTCNTGYRLIGSEEVTCSAGTTQNAAWSKLPSCEQISCPVLTSPARGAITPVACTKSNSVYGSTCNIACDPGFSLTSGPSTVTCSSSGQWSDTLSPVCTDTQPPALNCPSDVLVTAENGHVSAPVQWAAPTVTDNSGHVTVKANFNSGDSFSEGQHTVIVTATDGSGLSSTCNFSVTVQANRCPPLSPPAHGSLVTPNCDHLVGSTCRLQCDPGYTLSGSEHVTCSHTGGKTLWENMPTCAIMECPALTQPNNGEITPITCLTPGTAVGSKCSVTCQIGFTLTSGSSSTTCITSGKWDNQGPFVCTDTQPPSVTCPSDLTVIAESGQTSANVTWPAPLVTDNAGAEHVTLTSSLQPGTVLQEIHEPVYIRATDAAGNSAVCHFNVAVVVKRCKHLQGVALRVTSCDFVAGNTCTVSCGTGYILNGNNQVTCQHNGEYEPTWSSTPTCKTVSCPSLAAPTHGHVQPASCLVPGSAVNSTCSVSCDPGYDLVSGPASVTCTSAGQWDDTQQAVCEDREPPTVTCPSDISTTTTSGSSSPVSWSDPTVTDNAGDSQVTLMSSHTSGSVFREGQTNVFIRATDASGNTAICKFVVTVIVRRCPTLQPPDHGKLDHCNSEAGSTCRVTCDAGYVLNGSEEVTCSIDGDEATWGSTPSCVQPDAAVVG